jgi:putative heme-binding domain-containing protein
MLGIARNRMRQLAYHIKPAIPAACPHFRGSTMRRLLSGVLVLAALTTSRVGAARADDGAGDAEGVAVLLPMLAESADPQFQLDILKGINSAMEGRRNVAAPQGWAAVRDKLFASASRDVRQQAQSLAVVFGDAAAFDLMRKTLADRRAGAGERRQALASLVAANDPKLPPVLHALLDDAAVREPVLVALASYNAPQTPARVLAGYATYSVADRRAALGTLSSRTGYARQLVAAVRAGTVPAKDLTAATARQLRELGDPQVDAFVDEVWGVARTSPREKTDLMARYKALLTDDRVRSADASHGRAVFARTCAQCHTLYGTGGAVGPDLTGSNRFNLDYVLQNVIDPSAIIAREFQVTLVRTKDGRVLSGIAQEGDHAITIVSETGKVVVPREDIDKTKRSDLSMMPEGLVNGMSEKDFTDLVAYLRTTNQVEIPGQSK